MLRRNFLMAGGAAVASAGIAAPALSQGAAARTLRFVPQANLANFDPIWGTQYVVRNASAMVWDTLYGVDDTLTPRPQMVEGHTTSQDGLTWTFTLRPNLRFHDGEPVLARDVVASITRWMPRDPMGQMLRAIQNELVAVDDRTFRWVLRSPYPKLTYALGKTNTPICFIMPERIARTDPFQQIGEYVGSGPMRFIRNEWVPGARSVFQKFDGYVPREGGGTWLSASKRMMVDRVEWIVMPDPATAASALQNNEIDWWENPITDLVPLLRRNRRIQVDIADPLGNIGSFRMNHLHRPFNSQKVRQAILMAMSQSDYMRAIVGTDDALWKPLPGFFTPGTPGYTEAGGDILKGPRDLDAAKRLLSEGGYAGEPVTCLVAQDQPITKSQGDVTADLLRRLGMNVDFVATDWGTVGQRRAMKNPPGQGGWGMFHTWHAGADTVNPAAYNALRATGERAWFGWPESAEVEAGVAEWFAAPNAAAEKAAMDKVNAAAMRDVVYAPTGFFLGYTAWRSNVTGIQKGPLPFFWGVAKS